VNLPARRAGAVESVRKKDRPKSLRELEIQGLVRCGLEKNYVWTEAGHLSEKFAALHCTDIPTLERLQISVDSLLEIVRRALEAECHFMPSCHQGSQQPGQVCFGPAY